VLSHAEQLYLSSFESAWICVYRECTFWFCSLLCPSTYACYVHWIKINRSISQTFGKTAQFEISWKMKTGVESYKFTFMACLRWFHPLRLHPWLLVNNSWPSAVYEPVGLIESKDAAADAGGPLNDQVLMGNFTVCGGDRPQLQRTIKHTSNRNDAGDFDRLSHASYTIHQRARWLFTNLAHFVDFERSPAGGETSI